MSEQTILGDPGSQTPVKLDFKQGSGDNSTGFVMRSSKPVHSYAYALALTGDNQPPSSTLPNIPPWVSLLAEQLNSLICQYNVGLIAYNRDYQKDKSDHDKKRDFGNLQTMVTTLAGFLENLVWPPASIAADSTHFKSGAYKLTDNACILDNGPIDGRGGNVTLYTDQYENASWGYITNFSITYWSPSDESSMVGEPPPSSSSSLLFSSSSSSSGLRED